MIRTVSLQYLQTGVPGFDVLLDGGIPRYSFVVVTGAPGSGKTSLAHQIMFANASPEKRAIFFTVMGEPPLKMLRFQQQFSFFDVDKVGTSIKYLNLADDLQKNGFEAVLERIMNEVENFQPELIFVDSFKSVVQGSGEGDNSAALQYFVQRLGVHLATWQATTFLLGEYPEAHHGENPIFTVADCMIHLCQEMDQNAVVRKIRVVKMRGSQHMTGTHSMRMSKDGLHVYPRLLQLGDAKPERPRSAATLARLSTGSHGLDQMLDGGIPAGYSVLVAGLPGSGKSVLGTSFLAAGVAAGDAAVVASFEHILSPSPNPTLEELMQAGAVTSLPPMALDMSIEEFMTNLISEIDRTGAKRVVIDTLNALRLILAPQFRANFEESLFRMLSVLKTRGVTTLMIQNLSDAGPHVPGPDGFLVDGVIHMRYAEIGAKLIKLVSVPKLRGSRHSNEVCTYEVTSSGIEVNGPRQGK